MERAVLTNLLDQLPCTLANGGARLLYDPKAPAATRQRGHEMLDMLRRDGTDLRQGWLLIPTGGTSGEPRWARHDEETLHNAVKGFQNTFGIQKINTVDVLPPFHVSGLMARVRSLATGGIHQPVEWTAFAAGSIPQLAPCEEGWVISLVPTQLQRLLDSVSGASFLRTFRHVFLGGAPAWPSLLANARDAEIQLTPCYGSTETAAMVTALAPEDFLSGVEGVGRPLSHAKISLSSEGLVEIEAASLFRGYAGAPPASHPWRTQDLGRLDDQGRLHILGRADDVVITGGEKVSLGHLEQRLRDLLALADVAVVGVGDPYWGQKVVALVPAGASPSSNSLNVIENALAPHERPKAWVELDPWPRKENGKLDRSILRRAAGG